jgi:hypothetical protein
MLRLRSSNTAQLSVPVLLTPHGSLTGGMAIARHADNIGTTAPSSSMDARSRRGGLE